MLISLSLRNQAQIQITRYAFNVYIQRLCSMMISLGGVVDLVDAVVSDRDIHRIGDDYLPCVSLLPSR